VRFDRGHFRMTSNPSIIAIRQGLPTIQTELIPIPFLCMTTDNIQHRGDTRAWLSEGGLQPPISSISVGGPPDLPAAINDYAAMRLARENHSVWQTRSFPPVRPLTIGEVKAGLAVRIMKTIVHGDRAGRLI